MAASPRSPATAVATVLRVMGALAAANLAFGLWVTLGDLRWQHLVMTTGSSLLIAGILVARRTLAAGAPERALTQIYAAVFLAVAIALPLTRNMHTLVALGVVVLVLVTAPSVLPLARVNRWAQGAVAFGIVASAFDVLDLPTQLGASAEGFQLLVILGVAAFALISVRWFHRYPVETKLTIGFLLVSLLPLGIAGALRPLAPSSGATSHLIGLAVVATASVIAFIFGRIMATPLVAVAAAMERFTGGDLEARAPIAGGDEIGVVAERFNDLAVDLGRLLTSLRSEVEIRGARELELRAVNEALTAARDQATAASRAKSTFLAHMSHELRTPLNAIIGYSELIVEDSEQPTIRDDAGRVLIAGRHLLGIISDILDLSRVESGKLELELVDFDLIGLVRATCESSRSLFEGRGNQLLIVCARDRLRLHGDARKLRQVLLNLLSNAAKFTRGARVWCEVRVFEGADDPARGAVEISVRDEGIGIPEDRLATLFEPFTQVDSSPSRSYDGTGLGLTISRLFVAKMAGEITVRSVLGAGSTFTVRLPLEVAT